MSRVSIYENSWINLVFEGKNKKYGAYQLRKHSDRTTMIAFFMGLFFVTVALLANLWSGKNAPITIPDPGEIIIRLSNTPLTTPPKTEKQVIPATKKQNKEVDEKQLANPIVAEPQDADQNIAKTKDNTTNPTATEGTATTATIPFSGTGMPSTSPTDNSTTINSTVMLDKLPEFPGGINKFYKYVGNNFNNPETDEPKTIRVYVSFVIEKDGSMTDIQVKRDPGYGVGNEAIRVLKSLKTKWTPGLIAGKPVRTSYNLPITVQIQ